MPAGFDPGEKGSTIQGLSRCRFAREGCRMTTYYNDNDEGTVQWLRNLIDAGQIAPGDVDGRSITEVHPSDLKGYRQVHLFAGIGGWAYAARLAGWPAGRELWSASCPCQPWSVAGRREAEADPRDLWRHVVRLVRARRPARVVGEQVASAAGYAWFDRASADLAGENYASRAVDIPALAVNAPHQRQRLYWVAVANAVRTGLERSWSDDEQTGNAAAQSADAIAIRGNSRPWSRAVRFADGERRWRRGEPGICWLVDGISPNLVEICAGAETDMPPTRVKRAALWRGYGNAIVPQLGAEVLRALRDEWGAEVHPNPRI